MTPENVDDDNDAENVNMQDVDIDEIVHETLANDAVHVEEILNSEMEEGKSYEGVKLHDVLKKTVVGLDKWR